MSNENAVLWFEKYCSGRLERKIWKMKRSAIGGYLAEKMIFYDSCLKKTC